MSDVQGAYRVAQSEDFDVRALTKVGSYVYFADTDGLHRADVTTKKVEEVLKGSFVTALAGVGEDLYWVGTNASALYHASVTTVPSSSELLLDSVNLESFLLTSDDYLYFRPGSGAGYQRLLRTSADPTTDVETVESDLTPTGVGIDGGYAYFGAGTGMYRVPVTGGTPELIESFRPGEVIASGDTVFFTDTRSLSRKPVHTLNNGSGWTGLAIGRRILPDSSNRWKLMKPMLVGDRVYYREQSGALAWVTIDGSDCRIVADLYATGNATYSFTLDEAFFYALDQDNEIWAIPRDDVK